MSAVALESHGLWEEAARRRETLPSAFRRIRIGMPHLDAGGMSEGWLLRHAGNLHWETVARRLGVQTHELRGPGDERLYSSIVALRARYGRPLADVRENDVFDGAVQVAPCGRALAHGRLEANAGDVPISVELLTTFAFLEGDGVLRMSVPAAPLLERWTAGGTTPSALAALAKAARRGEPVDDEFAGPWPTAGATPSLGRWIYEPSPYVDYNGAGLLYFAAYVGIADSAERVLVRQLGLSPHPAEDWARVTSVVRRDVFYYCNLPLGQPLAAELLACDRIGPTRVKTRMRFYRWNEGAGATGEVMADLVTEREIAARGR